VDSESTLCEQCSIKETGWSKRFCSKYCKDAFCLRCSEPAARAKSAETHALALSDYKNNPKRCRKCDVVLLYEKRKNIYCSRSCAVISNNSVHPKRIAKKWNCESCDFLVTHGRKYCDGCNPNGLRTLGNARSIATIRRELLKIRGNQCEGCGLAEWCGEVIPLNLDHEDGNPDNNDLDNLRFLCPNCHSLTPTFGSKNRSRFPGADRIKKREAWRTEQRNIGNPKRI
jgi:hypothetical protein